MPTYICMATSKQRTGFYQLDTILILPLQKRWTLCPSQRVTRVTLMNKNSHDQHKLNENFAIDQKSVGAAYEI